MCARAPLNQNYCLNPMLPRWIVHHAWGGPKLARGPKDEPVNPSGSSVSPQNHNQKGPDLSSGMSGCLSPNIRVLLAFPTTPMDGCIWKGQEWQGAPQAWFIPGFTSIWVVLGLHYWQPHLMGQPILLFNMNQSYDHPKPLGLHTGSRIELPAQGGWQFRPRTL